MILSLLLVCFFAAVAGKTKHKAEPTVCDCQNVTVTGSHVHTTRMGTFVFVPDVLHDGHAVYINDHHEYLYFYAPIWLVGNDYTKNMAGVRSIGNGVCPTNVPSWEHYVDGKWTVIPLKITCKRVLHKSPKKQSKGSKTGRSSKPEATIKGNWKLVPSHGDKEIMVVQKKGRTSQEVIMNYRKSKDRKHQVTMLNKDCDTPLPFDVAVYDSIEGAVIDDIQSITVVIDFDLVAAQKARLWALCVKLALLADTAEIDTSAYIKTVAEHFTQVTLVSHQGMDEVTLERVAALDEEISRLNKYQSETRAKRLAKALDVLKHRVRQDKIDDGSCSPEQLDHLAKTRQNLADLEKELATLSKDLELEKLQALSHPGDLGNQKPGMDGYIDQVPESLPEFYFKLEVCQCNFAAVTRNSVPPLCEIQALEPSTPFDLCMAVDSDTIYIKEIVAVTLTASSSDRGTFVVAPVDRNYGPQNTVVRYFGKFASLQTKTTLGYFMPNSPYDVEVKGTVTLASPNPASKMNDLSVDFALPIPINHGPTDAPQSTRQSKRKRKRKRKS